MGFFGTLIFAIIARMLRGNHLNILTACLHITVVINITKTEAT